MVRFIEDHQRNKQECRSIDEGSQYFDPEKSIGLCGRSRPRRKTQRQKYLSPRAATSVSIWPASAIKARLLVRYPAHKLDKREKEGKTHGNT